MKNIRLSVMWLCLAIAVVLVGCTDRSVITYNAKVLVPVYLSLEDLRAGFAVESTKPLKEPGKIYIYKNFLFINEALDGVHIVDNSNPASPQFIKYLRIPGCSDITVINDVLIANSGPDLLSISIANINDIKILNREEDVFFDRDLLVNGQYFIGNVEKEEVKKEYSRRGWDFGFGIGMQEDKQVSLASGSESNATGLAGSTARFAITANFLYVVDNTSLIPIDISNPADPKRLAEVLLNRGTIETIFRYENYLYIGSTNGVFIYDYMANQSSPVFVSVVEHIRRCDPVVVDNDIAFSTLRTGSRCGGGDNELMVLDVKNPKNPVSIKSYFFSLSPYGLGVDGNRLFICFGSGGIRQYSITDLKKISENQLASDPTIDATDIVLNNGNAIVTGSDGIFQYRYEADGKLVKLSSLFAK